MWRRYRTLRLVVSGGDILWVDSRSERSMLDESQKPGFGDLPQALVLDLLEQSRGTASLLQGNLQRLTEEIPELRKNLGVIRSDKNLPFTAVPTSCGVDGSYIVEKLLSTDLAAFAALAVEGVTPPSEKRFWPDPRHFARVMAVPHHESTSQILRGLMMCHELRLATEAPHDVVLLDNSLKTFLIYLNNGTTTVAHCPSAELAELFVGALDCNSRCLLGDSRTEARSCVCSPPQGPPPCGTSLKGQPLRRGMTTGRSPPSPWLRASSWARIQLSPTPTST